MARCGVPIVIVSHISLWFCLKTDAHRRVRRTAATHETEPWLGNGSAVARHATFPAHDAAICSAMWRGVRTIRLGSIVYVEWCAELLSLLLFLLHSSAMCQIMSAMFSTERELIVQKTITEAL